MNGIRRSSFRIGHGGPIPVAAVLLACGLGPLGAPARAQVGSGWIETSFTKRVHLDDDDGLQTFGWAPYRSVCSPDICADYRYDSATDTETFRIFDGRSNRSEIRLQNEYSSGRWQFEGYVTFHEPLHDESLFQIFGNSGSAATYLMMRGYRDDGGTIRVMSGSNTIASGVYGREVRINVIHEQDVSARFYVDGELIYTKPDGDTAATNYWKYGCYGTTSGNVPAVVEWRAVRTFRDGLPPGLHLAANPGALTVAQGGSATAGIELRGFSGAVRLSADGTPPGTAAAFSPATIRDGAGSSTLLLRTAAGTPTGSYVLTVRATDGGDAKVASVRVGVLPASCWADRDIGDPALDGNAGQAGDTFTINGAGADIGSSSDQFNFLHRNLSGNVMITARVASQEDTHGWAKSGVMIRESLATGSPHVGLYVTPANGVSMQYRSSADGGSTNLAGAGGLVAPYWVRLVRSGDTFSGYRSPDGIHWTLHGRADVRMDADVKAGLAVTSHDATRLCTGTFSDVSLAGESAVPEKGLVAHYSFDDGTARDVSGNGNHGTLAGSAVVVDDPVRGRVLSLDGAGGKVDLGSPVPLDITGEITITAWVNCDSGGGGGMRNVVNRGHGGSPSRELTLRLDSSSPAHYDFGSWESGIGDRHATVPVPPGDVGSDTWVHLAGTWDGVRWNLYRNGVLEDSLADAAGVLPMTAGWAIGARGGVAGFERVFSGRIDDVRVYTRALSGAEIRTVDSVPDACQTVRRRATFRRGDCNDDGTVDISDAVSTLGSLFLGDDQPSCDDACDSNDDGAVDISDAINTLGVLFLGNGVIPLPGVTKCGVDPTDDQISCHAFEKCP